MLFRGWIKTSCFLYSFFVLCIIRSIRSWEIQKEPWLFVDAGADLCRPNEKSRGDDFPTKKTTFNKWITVMKNHNYFRIYCKCHAIFTNLRSLNVLINILNIGVWFTYWIIMMYYIELLGSVRFPVLSFPRGPISRISFTHGPFPHGPFPRKHISPKTRFPELRFLELRFPELTFPRISFPRVTFPRISFPRVMIPRISFPRVTFPRIPFPRVTFPRITFPRVTFPRISFPWN
jgi:hypothetical protein